MIKIAQVKLVQTAKTPPLCARKYAFDNAHLNNFVDVVHELYTTVSKAFYDIIYQASSMTERTDAILFWQNFNIINVARFINSILLQLLRKISWILEQSLNQIDSQQRATGAPPIPV
jgi:hypothetical protein